LILLGCAQSPRDTVNILAGYYTRMFSSGGAVGVISEREMVFGSARALHTLGVSLGKVQL